MPRLENGFVYLWALFSVMLAGVAMAGAAQIWQTKSQREKEVELMFIGEEFRKAIMSYYNSGPKQYPNSLEDLLQDSRTPNVRRHLRKLYVDPITNTTEWGLVHESAPDSSAASRSASSANDSSASDNPQSPSDNPASGGSLSGSPQSSSSNPALTNNQASRATQPSNKSPAAVSNSAPTKSSGISSSIAKGITGIYSLSERKPIKKDQFPEHLAKFSEATSYKDWQFIYKPGDTKASSGSASAKPGAASTPATGSSPFSSQSSPTSSKGSPFSSPSSSPTDSKAPGTGFPSTQ
ncbi:hypothetical protein [Nitrosomonas sp. Nm166]|uniref:hypothetical protein n=1 Tax=Nitrosomonas sp. Nm166 TaxID=1881054 RepID=UPI0008F1F5D9|nr:hypothetical protein [Nitrosomonas sp. Nm166]SFE59143.1 hypothetical protein SAMN05428977_102146 [Nitrosomonas sp. Nm166]